MKKICLIEDDAGISSSLTTYLGNSEFDVLLYESGDGAANWIESHIPDIVILDINLPEKNGMEVCRELRESSSIPVIMLTARGGEKDKIQWLEIGADDYIEKPFSPRELLARINALLRRVESPQPQHEETSHKYTYKNVILDTQTTQVQADGIDIPLTKNEYDILEKIMEANGKLVSRESLMKDVIGYENYIYDRTIDTHIKNLRKKIGDKDMILTIRGKWYRLNV